MAAPDFADVLEPGDHGSTFAGGPVAAAAALAVLEIVDDPELLRRVRELGATLRERLEASTGREVRGRGLMIGVGLEDGSTQRGSAPSCSSPAWSSTCPSRARCGCCRR